jgi:hypothetical protein
MELPIDNNKTPFPLAIAAPRAIDGTGSALRRSFPTPGAPPIEMARLLRQLDETISRSAG